MNLDEGVSLPGHCTCFDTSQDLTPHFDICGSDDNSEFSFLKSEFWKKHTETARNPDFTRLRIFGTVLKSENNTVQQYDLQNRRLVLFNLGTWGTEVPL